MRQGATVERAAWAEAGGRAGARGQVERVLELAVHLPAGDRFLLRQVFEFGARVPNIARQAGLPRGRIYRRIRTLLRRLRAPVFAFVAGRRLHLPPPARGAVELIVFHGLSHRETALRTGQTVRAVERHLRAVLDEAR